MRLVSTRLGQCPARPVVESARQVSSFDGAVLESRGLVLAWLFPRVSIL